MADPTEPENPDPKAVVANGNVVTSSAKVTAFGRVDSADDLDRAAEATRELERLKTLLPTLTDDELSAYSAQGLSIGTFLNSRGHAFSVLTEEMLAQQFKDELEWRKVAHREGWRLLTDDELSAYSAQGLSIGTFLNSRGHAFSVLTEEMLAQQFKDELEWRKVAHREDGEVSSRRR